MARASAPVGGASGRARRGHAIGSVGGELKKPMHVTAQVGVPPFSAERSGASAPNIPRATLEVILGSALPDLIPCAGFDSLPLAA